MLQRKKLKRKQNLDFEYLILIGFDSVVFLPRVRGNLLSDFKEVYFPWFA